MSTSDDSNDSSGAGPEVISGRSARWSASQMDIGNIVAVLIPPLGMLWFAISMLVYAWHRHHPDPKVGHYTQWAAYRYYGVMGSLIPIATFFPGKGIGPWLVAWAVAVAVIIPWSIWSLYRIYTDTWEDTVLPVQETSHD